MIEKIPKYYICRMKFCHYIHFRHCINSENIHVHHKSTSSIQKYTQILDSLKYNFHTLCHAYVSSNMTLACRILSDTSIFRTDTATKVHINSFSSNIMVEFHSKNIIFGNFLSHILSYRKCGCIIR